MAQSLASLDALVVGIDITHYLNMSAKSIRCFGKSAVAEREN